jgi:hypothetical protein
MVSFNQVGSTSTRQEGSVTRKSATQWRLGEQYIGYLAGIEQMNSRYGTMTVYVMKDADGEGKLTGKETHLISSAGLAPLLNQVETGQLVQLTCSDKNERNRKVSFNLAVADMKL